MKNYYKILGIDIDHSDPASIEKITADNIKAAYRKMALVYHPDKNSAPNAAIKFALIKEAYDV